MKNQNLKEACREWKQEKIACKKYKAIVQATKNQVRKAKTLIELNPARDVKGNK